MVRLLRFGSEICKFQMQYFKMVQHILQIAQTDKSLAPLLHRILRYMYADLLSLKLKITCWWQQCTQSMHTYIHMCALICKIYVY